MNPYDVTLCFICRNGDKEEMKTLPAMLKSARPHVADICATVTVTQQDEELNDRLVNLLDKYECKLSKFVWVNDFSAARDYNFAQAQTELVLWLDSDDVLVGGDNMVKAVEKFRQNAQLNEIWMNYHYDHDEDGNVLSVFPRERIVKKSIHRWVGKLHENAICKYMPVGHLVDDIHVRHNTKHFDVEQKAIRNLNIIRETYAGEKKAGKLDPRTVYDLARSYHALFALNEAEEHFREFIDLTESDQDFYDALIRLVDIYTITNRMQAARDACHQAIKVNFDWPDAYYALAKVALIEELWEECLHWIAVGKMHKPPKGGLPVDPTKYTVKAAKMVQKCLFMMGKAHEALKVIEDALRVSPSDKELKLAGETITKYLNQITLEKGFLAALDWLTENDERSKIPDLLAGQPECVRDLPQWVKLHNELHPIDGKDRLVLYCHGGYEQWDGDSWKDGIGGSEEAVINMARNLAKLKWKVEVYNECRKPGMYDGVQYQPFYRFDPNQPADVFICWRIPEYMVFKPAEDSLRLVWLHDKQQMDYYTPEILNAVDKLMPLSMYHRNDLPEISDTKFYVTRNGIDPKHFEQKAERDLNKYIYASSPDRGLEHILNHWKEIKAINPQAHLHIFYGFTRVYDKLMDNDPQRRIFKEKIMDLIARLPDVHYHGRVGHEELAREFLSSGYWLYPTAFPEISCITAMKAQAAGCWPVVTDFAALPETVKYGTFVHGDIDKPATQVKFVEAVRKAMTDATDEKREEMAAWAKKHFAWDNLAAEWNDNMRVWLSDKRKVEVAV